ncbi:hypothetical protein, partial [Priestia flexa]|uniref:hypothetical protein n=1 Tax=Priestia flexa TaxID=86664 RepID=UPI003CFD35ED
ISNTFYWSAMKNGFNTATALSQEHVLIKSQKIRTEKGMSSYRSEFMPFSVESCINEVMVLK